MAHTENIKLKIGGMHCAGCVHNVESALTGLGGVKSCSVNLVTNAAAVTFDDGNTTTDQIISAVEGAGFKAEVVPPDVLETNVQEEESSKVHFRTALYAAIPLMIVSMWPMLFSESLVSPSADGIIAGALSAFILFFSGLEILKDAWNRARHLSVNMNSLIAVGSLAAFGWSVYGLVLIYGGRIVPLYFESAGMIITLILLGRSLEAKARRQAGSAIEELLNLRPTVATALINGVEVPVEPGAIKPEMLLLVRPGERIPADGEVVEGKPVIDESVLTGESFPVEKRPGHAVVGGALNGLSPFKMKVTNTGTDSFLNSIIRMVTEAQSRKAPAQHLADRVAARFVPFVFAAAIVTGLVWYFFGAEIGVAVKSAVAVLIIACPCALGLATPTAVLAGSGRGAKHGILFRGGDILEELSEIDTVVFDKTGTLTKGQLEVVAVKTVGQLSEQNMIRMVGSAESQSEHPVGQAITRYMKERQINPAVVRDVKARPGFGIEAVCDGRPLILGSRSLLEENGIALGPLQAGGEQEMELGRTVVFVAYDNQVVGLLALADQIRGESKDVINYLKSRNIEMTMITGDNRKTAAGVAHSLDLDHFEAEITPAQKQLVVESFRRAGKKVAMIGDGINDAPSLAVANVGIAVGSGTDVAIETSDVVLVRPGLEAVMDAFVLAEETRKTIRGNLFWAFFYNVVAIPIAAGALYPVAGLSLSPIIAAAAMAFSSVFVVTNSLRLNTLRLSADED